MFRLSRSTLNHLPRVNATTARTKFAFLDRSLTTAAAITQKNVRNRNALAWGVAGVFMATGGFLTFKKPIYLDAPTPQTGIAQEPVTQTKYPIQLETDGQWKSLVGFGVRAISFLKVNVYVVGLYMTSQDIAELKKLQVWKSFDKNKFLQDEKLAKEFLEQPYDVTIRIVPTRSTNTQHLRDGFLRALMARMKEEQSLTEEEEKQVLGAFQEFKKNFVNMKVEKGTEFLFTKTTSGGLKMVYEGQDLGTVNNRWLATNFFMCYLDPKTPSSEAALYDIANGFQSIMDSKK